jgi:hypothetical protein
MKGEKILLLTVFMMTLDLLAGSYTLTAVQNKPIKKELKGSSFNYQTDEYVDILGLYGDVFSIVYPKNNQKPKLYYYGRINGHILTRPLILYGSPFNEDFDIIASIKEALDSNKALEVSVASSNSSFQIKSLRTTNLIEQRLVKNLTTKNQTALNKVFVNTKPQSNKVIYERSKPSTAEEIEKKKKEYDETFESAKDFLAFGDQSIYKKTNNEDEDLKLIEDMETCLLYSDNKSSYMNNNYIANVSNTFGSNTFKTYKEVNKNYVRSTNLEQNFNNYGLDRVIAGLTCLSGKDPVVANGEISFKYKYTQNIDGIYILGENRT